MRDYHKGEEKREHGRPVNEKPHMKELRTDTATTHDSPASIQRGGGEDPRRFEAQIIVDRAVRDHDVSGYNHNGVISDPESALGNNEHMRKMQAKAMGMGTPEPDGIYRR